MKASGGFTALIGVVLGVLVTACGDRDRGADTSRRPNLPKADAPREKTTTPRATGAKVATHLAADRAAALERAAERTAMVERQLVGRDIRDQRVLDAIRRVPRHLFVPENRRRAAYADQPLPIGLRQTISQPYIVAYMTQALKLHRHDRVLEIGTGSGYQAAILAELVREVFTIEIIPELGQRSRKLLTDLGYQNIHVRVGDGYQGWPDKAPFDAIIVTAAPPKLPQPLLAQLKIGGRMIIPIGNARQELVFIRRTEKGYERNTMLPVVFVPMTGEAQRRPTRHPSRAD